MQVLEIEKNSHRLPGFGRVSYVLNPLKHELVIYIDDIKNRRIVGDDALSIFDDVKKYYLQGSEREKVLYMIERAFGITVDQLRQRTRKREIVQVRQIAAWWLKNNSKLSLAAIGNFLGGYDHATVSYSHKTVCELIESNRPFRDMVNDFLLFQNSEKNGHAEAQAPDGAA